MKCEKAEKHILLQDSGELADHLMSPLAMHLHNCDPCQQFQHTLLESHNSVQSTEEPSIKIMQNVLREARQNAPEKSPAAFGALRPLIGVAASLLIGLGVFFSAFNPDQVGMELVVTEMQLLKSSDQLVSIMYEGFSEDDLAFNFFMTYEGS
ncbi:MAG: hypothetical protein V3V05_13270 [Pontiella sp.]